METTSPLDQLQTALVFLKEWREERLGSKPSQTVPAYYGAQDTARTEKMSMQRIAASAGCYGAMAALPEQKVPSAVGGVTGVNIHNSQGPTNTHGVSRYHQRNMETTSSLDQVQTALVSVEPWNDANRLMIPDVHARARTESLDPPIIMGTRKSERVSCLPQHLAACATIALLCALARDIVIFSLLQTEPFNGTLQEANELARMTRQELAQWKSEKALQPGQTVMMKMQDWPPPERLHVGDRMFISAHVWNSSTWHIYQRGILPATLRNREPLHSLADPYVFMHREKTKAGKPLFNRGRAYCPSRRITTSNVDSAATGRTGTRA